MSSSQNAKPEKTFTFMGVKSQRCPKYGYIIPAGKPCPICGVTHP